MSKAQEDFQFLASLIRQDGPLSGFCQLGNDTSVLLLTRVMSRLGHDATPMTATLNIPFHGGGDYDTPVVGLRIESQVWGLGGEVGEDAIVASAIQKIHAGMEYSEFKPHKRKKPQAGEWGEIFPQVQESLLALTRFHYRANGGPNPDELIESALAQIESRDLQQHCVPAAQARRSPRI